MSTILRIERANHEQSNCCFNFGALLEKILGHIQRLFSFCLGRDSEEGSPSVYYEEEPIQMDCQDIMSLKVVEIAPPSWLNQVCVKNASETDIGFVEVLTHSETRSTTILKTDLKLADLSSMASGVQMQESYQLEILVSKTADCSVPLEATDPFLIEGAYRNEIAKILWDYHQIVEPIRDARALYDALVRIGDYTLPETLPAPLLKQLTTLVDTYRMHATAESVKAVSEQHRQTIRERKDTLRIVTPPINISGKTLITIHDDHVQVTFEGRGKSFRQTEQFLEA